MNENLVRVTTTSSDQPVEKKFSKINGKFCTYRVKIFSADGAAQTLPDDTPVVRSYTVEENGQEVQKFFADETSNEKKFSVTSIRERMRMQKFSTRQYMRRLLIDYKKLWQMSAGNMSDEDKKILRGLFISDMMNIMNKITPEIKEGKNINTLLGLSAFGKELRVAAQKLQLPYRLLFREEERLGAPSKKRYMDVQEVYNDFMRALLNYVFPGDQNNLTLQDGLGTVSQNSETGGIKIS